MTAALADAPSPSTPVLTLVDPGADPAELSVEELGSRIVGLAGRLAAATCQWLLLVAQFDARDGCARFGLASTARWLTHCCGLSHRAAVDHVRVARTLAGFPQLAAAMTAGRVSYSHVRAIARVARPGDTQAVDDLLDVAESGTVGQLETIVRGLRTVEDQRDGDAQPEEYVRTGWSSHSQWQLAARLDPERGALVHKALEAMRVAEDLTAAEALERMAEVALVVLADAGRAPTLRGEERAAVVVHLDLVAARSIADANANADADADADAAEPGSATAPPRGQARDSAPQAPAPRLRRALARLVDGPGLPDAVIDRLLCDGRLRTSLHRTDGSMFDLGRTRRVVSTRLFRALLDRDGCCTHPGCHSRAGLEAHHVRHWLYGGRTDLANLVLLCRRHHHAHHHEEFAIGIRPDGAFVFRRPDGRVLEEHVDPGRLMTSAPAAPSTPVASAASGHPRWTGTGERLDRHYAIAVLAQRRQDTAPLAS